MCDHELCGLRNNRVQGFRGLGFRVYTEPGARVKEGKRSNWKREREICIYIYVWAVIWVIIMKSRAAWVFRDQRLGGWWF